MMTLTTFMLGLAICSAFTALVTEAIKKMLEGKVTFSDNILCAIVSVVVAAFVCVAYVLTNSIEVTTAFVVYSVILVILSWLCAMVGYDKVIQTIEQLKRKGD